MTETSKFDEFKEMPSFKDIKEQYDPETRRYRMKYPFRGEGRDIKEVTLRRFKMTDMDDFETAKSDYERTKKMVIASAQIAPGELGEMDPDDAKVIAEIISTFL